MNNTFIHHMDGIVDKIQEVGAMVMFIPAYRASLQELTQELPFYPGPNIECTSTVSACTYSAHNPRHDQSIA